VDFDDQRDDYGATPRMQNSQLPVVEEAHRNDPEDQVLLLHPQPRPLLLPLLA
jgi:hypothetical protein